MKTVEEGLTVWVGDQGEVPGFCLWTGPDLAVRAIWEMDHQTEKSLFPSLSISLSCTYILNRSSKVFFISFWAYIYKHTVISREIGLNLIWKWLTKMLYHFHWYWRKKIKSYRKGRAWAVPDRETSHPETPLLIRAVKANLRGKPRDSYSFARGNRFWALKYNILLKVIQGQFP